jgi:hypothetical protein
LDPNGIFLIVIGLLIIIFSKAFAKGIYEFWKPIFSHRFYFLGDRIIIIMGGVFVITLGVLALIGLIKPN